MKEKETLRRSYFLFVAAVVTNDVIVVLTTQSECLFLNDRFYLVLLFTPLILAVLTQNLRPLF